MILSYYSYANAVSRLITLNRQRGNVYQEKQDNKEKVPCLSWLDYFLIGEVFSVGFGYDLSEFDIWWAIERKAREKANHGILHAFMIDEKDDNTPQKALFDAMDVHLHQHIAANKDYLAAYEKVLEEIHNYLFGE